MPEKKTQINFTREEVKTIIERKLNIAIPPEDFRISRFGIRIILAE